MSEINGANGAFAIATGKIYLAQEFIDTNVNNLRAITAVLLEEYGHYVDSRINKTDAAGDEGDIFARLVQGKTISQSELAALKAEDDHATVTLDGQVVQIEMNVSLTTSQKTYAEKLTSLFENSTTTLQYGYAENINDGRGITAGRAGFTSGTGDMYDVVNQYRTHLGSFSRKDLQRFFPFYV